MAQKFYKLTESEWKEILNKVTKVSQYKVLFHLKICDPFGDRNLEYRVIDLAKALGLSERTIYRTIKELTEMNLIEAQPTAYALRVQSVGNMTPMSVSVTPVSDAPRVESVGNMTPMSVSVTPMSVSVTPVSEPVTPMSKSLSPMSEPVTPMSKSIGETLAVTKFEKSSDYKTNKTNKDSLSDRAQNYFDWLKNLWPEERESWNKFVQDKIQELPRKVVLRDEWLIASGATGKPRWESMKREWESNENLKAYTKTVVPVGVDSVGKSMIDKLIAATSAEEVKRNIFQVHDGWLYGNHVEPIRLEVFEGLTVAQIKALLKWREL